jgi:hypothetical protein
MTNYHGVEPGYPFRYSSGCVSAGQHACSHSHIVPALCIYSVISLYNMYDASCSLICILGVKRKAPGVALSICSFRRGTETSDYVIVF